eukprot:6050133-Amphidinium_carterae.1
MRMQLSWQLVLLFSNVQVLLFALPLCVHGFCHLMLPPHPSAPSAGHLGRSHPGPSHYLKEVSLDPSLKVFACQ